MFFCHFCHNHHQNYLNYHHNYHCNHHYPHQNLFGHMRKTLFLTSEKRGPSCPNWGDGGLGDSGNARKKTLFSYWCLPLLPLHTYCCLKLETCCIQCEAKYAKYKYKYNVRPNTNTNTMWGQICQIQIQIQCEAKYAKYKYNVRPKIKTNTNTMWGQIQIQCEDKYKYNVRPNTKTNTNTMYGQIRQIVFAKEHCTYHIKQFKNLCSHLKWIKWSLIYRHLNHDGFAFWKVNCDCLIAANVEKENGEFSSPPS